MGTLVPLLALLFLSCLTPAHQQSDEETVSLPLTPPIASAEVVKQNDSTCPSSEAQNFVNDALQPMILSTIDIVVPCTQRVKGLVPHCPASNCTELFNLAQEEGVILLSDYYWLMWANGEVRKVYCNRDTQQPEYSSCEAFLELDDLSGVYTIRSPGGTAVTVYCNSETGETEYFSCDGIHQVQPDLPSGMYTIRSSEGNPVTVYCDMDREECGGGVWTRVANSNYSDPSVVCPNNWTQVTAPFRGCTHNDFDCAALSLSIPMEYAKVCGKVIAVQRATPEAFIPPNDIENYVEGVSITHGNPKQHIWTFAAYPSDDYTNEVYFLCPCSQPSLNVPPPPSFVGNNYFCDTGAEIQQSGWHLDDPLWDGQGCSSPSTCCTFNNPPWFSTTLPQNTTDDIEVRICRHACEDNIAIIMLELYVK